MAEQLCRRALEKYPADGNLLCLCARALNRLGQSEQAEQRVNDAIRLYPDFPAPHAILGQIHMSRGEPELAASAFRRAIELEPERANTHMKLAMALMRSGDVDGAKAAIELSKQLDPSRALIEQAAQLERSGDRAAAEKIYREILKHDPDNVEALRLLAGIAAGRRFYGDAEDLLKRVIELAPQYTRALADLISVQLERDKVGDAVKNAERLVRLDDKQAEVQLLLASAYASVDRFDEAIEAYQNGLKLAPGHSAALMGIGNMLKTIGRVDEAIEAYRHCIEQHPQYAEAYWSLANLKTFRFDAREISAMKELLQNDGLPADARVQLHNALGLEAESAGNYEQAFDYFATGNDLRRQSESYDPVETEDLHDRTIDLFNATFFERHSEAGDTETSPVFIVGLPRSGSTLIEQILASHSKVEGTHELSVLGRLAQSTLKRGDMLVKFPDILERFETGEFGEIGERYIERTRVYRAGKALFIDKNPNNFLYIGLLKLILPNAKIIDARRHPLDSCFGSYKQLFARGQPFSYDMVELGEYYLQYARLMRHWHDVLPGFVLEVRYEDVIEDLEREVRRLLEFCELPFEDGCLRFYESGRAVKTASSEQVRQPIYASSVNLWRNYEQHLDELIEVLEPELEKLPESERPSILQA